jgi:Ca2+-binding RTX toxin-like protein
VWTSVWVWHETSHGVVTVKDFFLTNSGIDQFQFVGGTWLNSQVWGWTISTYVDETQSLDNGGHRRIQIDGAAQYDWTSIVTDTNASGDVVSQIRYYDDGTSVTGTLGTNADDVMNGSTLADVLLGLGGNDTLNGGLGNDALDGGAGNDALDGGTGNDSMAGGAGNDSYVVESAGDIVTEAANEGTDTVTSSITYTLTDNVENLILSGSAAINGTGNALDNVITGNSGINVLTGNDGNDTLYGGDGNDNISGGAGNDTLDGGTGNDSMTGGTGNDIYYVDSASDTITESTSPSGGTDLVYSSINYTLGIGLENLTLLPGATTGTGNSSDNIIIGNASANTLSGSGGNDTLDGGAGIDTLTGGTGNDIFVLNRGDGGGDTITDFSGNGPLTADSFRFVGYGTAAQGATFTRIGTTNQWQINSADGLVHDIITLSNNASVHASDYVFM